MTAGLSSRKLHVLTQASIQVQQLIYKMCAF